MSCGCLYRNEIIGELQKSLIKKSDFRNIFECDRDYTNVDDRFFLLMQIIYHETKVIYIINNYVGEVT